MKRNTIIAVLSVMALALASCQREPVPVDPGTADEGQVAVDMMVTLPGAGLQTKALGSNPVIRNIYVAVFGMNKYLNEFVKAVPVDGSGHIAHDYTPYDDNSDGIADKYRVRVILSRNATTRYVHVVANVNEASIPDFGYENEFMDALTSDEGDGYWQYLEFPEADGGIFNAVPTNPNYSKSANARLSSVTLIRDFAWIDVTVGPAVTATWDFEAYEVYNTPDKGFYPIVTSISGDDYTFSTDYVSNTFEENISTYGGRLAPDAKLKPEGSTFPEYIPTEFAAGATGSKFVYENPESGTSTSTFIVLRLKKKPDGPIKYFRIDLENASGYIPVLRNYHYTVNISGIGVEGAATPREAATTRSKSNAFTGVDVSRLSELNDGISTLRVGYTEKVFCSPVTGEEFLYRYTPDKNSPTTYGPATLSAPDGDAIISNRSADWATGGTPSTATGFEGWRKVTFDIAAIPASGQQSSTFTVTGKNTTTGSSITQTITIITMPKQSFITSEPPSGDVSSAATLISESINGKLYKDGDTYKLFFKLPGDLPRSLFPLTLIFDQGDNKIAPARPGTLVEIDETTSDIKYAKEVTLATYEASKEVQFWFKATKTISSGDKLKVRDRNKTYFNEVEVALHN